MPYSKTAIEIVIKAEGNNTEALKRALRCALEDLETFRPSLESLRVTPGTPFCGGMGSVYSYELQINEVDASAEFIAGIEASALAKRQEFR